MKSNRRALSIVKTSFILFHSKKLKPYKTFNLKINGINIQQVSTVQYLGVTFDVGKNTGKEIPPGNCSPASFPKGTYPESMFLSSVTSNEVEDFISQMNKNKTTGPFSTPDPLLKILKTHIAPLLSSLINDSFLCGTFPNKLKLAKVTPVFKKGFRQDKDNYRPISVLSIFSKIFEKAMYKRLYSYLECHSILYPLQFGFRRKHSTNHALLSITESIRYSIGNNEFGSGIFIDLKKAFDTVLLFMEGKLEIRTC